MTSQIHYNGKLQIFLTQMLIYLIDNHKVTYEEFSELSNITRKEFSKFMPSFKEMITDLKINADVILKKDDTNIDNPGQFKSNIYYFRMIDNDYSFDYDDLDEYNLIKYSMTIVYLMLKNHKHITSSYLSEIFPRFTRKTMQTLISNLKEIVSDDIVKNELSSYKFE